MHTIFSSGSTIILWIFFIKNFRTNEEIQKENVFICMKVRENQLDFVILQWENNIDWW